MAKTPTRGDVWIVDLGMVAKVRPCLVISIPADVDRDRVLMTLVPHTTGTRGSRFEVKTDVRFLKPGAFDAQNLVTVPTVKLGQTARPTAGRSDDGRGSVRPPVVGTSLKTGPATGVIPAEAGSRCLSTTAAHRPVPPPRPPDFAGERGPRVRHGPHGTARAEAEAVSHRKRVPRRRPERADLATPHPDPVGHQRSAVLPAEQDFVQHTLASRQHVHKPIAEPSAADTTRLIRLEPLPVRFRERLPRGPARGGEAEIDAGPTVPRPAGSARHAHFVPLDQPSHPGGVGRCRVGDRRSLVEFDQAEPGEPK